MIQPNIEAEKSVIGAILLDYEKVMPVVLDVLTDEHFLTAGYKEIFKRMMRLYNDGQVVDLVTVMSGNEDLKLALYKCAEFVPSTVNVREYANLVKETWQKHTAHNQLLDITEQLETADISTIQDDILNLSKIFDKQSTRQVTLKEAIYSFYDRMNDTKVDYIKTGLKKLDTGTYISKGDYVIIGARPSVGKTALALNFARNISAKHRTVFFSLETSVEKLTDRYVSLMSMTDFESIKKRKLTSEEWENIAKVSEHETNKNFTMVEASGWTVAQIRAKALELRAEVIFIDYIGLVKSEGRSLYEKTTNTSKDLHTLAQKEKITVFGLAQLNRNAAQEKENKFPSMSDLRDSGQVEQDADVIILLHKVKQENAVIEDYYKHYMIVEKNKDGNTGDLEVNFIGRFMKFEG